MTEMNTTTKECRSCGIVKCRADFVVNKQNKDLMHSYCKACVRIKSKENRVKYQEKNKEYSKKYYNENKEKYKIIAENTVERRRAASRKWLNANREKQYERNRVFFLKNPGLASAYYKIREIRKRRAVPAWADLAAIKEIYRKSVSISKETGILHHVDHYYPLAGKNVCGLHVIENLRIVPATVNLTKSNSFPLENFKCQLS